MIHTIINKSKTCVTKAFALLALSFAFVACQSDIEDTLTYYPTLSENDATYYIDAENGNDTNDGLTEATAWKSLARGSVIFMQGGNKILLKRGATFKGQLAPKGSGTPNNPIVIGAYGEGERPKLDGEGLVNGVVYIKNESNWVVQDLEVVNYADERGGTYRSGILIENLNGGTTSNIQIRNNYVHDISSSFRYYGEFGPHQFGGIAVNVTGKTPSDKFDNVLIEGNVVEKAGRTGIVVWDTQFGSYAESSTKVVIKNNKVKNIDSDGILTYGCNGALIEYNVADGCGSYREDDQFNGSAAIWCTRGSDCIIQYNEAYNTHALEGNDDGTGFDIDMDAINCIVQYNYSHDNEGGFMLFVDASNSNGSIVRYNVSQNDKTRIFMIAGGVTPNTQIYNNTIYIKEGLDTKIIDHTWDDGGDINASWMFKNNIVYNLGTGGYRIPGTGGTIEGNVFYGNHPESEPNDALKLTVDPQLVNPGSALLGLESLGGYLLKETSPLLNTGVFVPKNGGKDLWGNVVSPGGKPTRGAHEPSGDVQGEFLMTDPLNDWSYTSFHTENWGFDSSNPHYFWGDMSRVVRGNLEDGIIVYEYPNIQSASVVVHLSIWYPSLSPAAIKLYTSSIGGDFGNYTEVAVEYDTDPSIVDGWQGTTIKTVGDLPEGTNFLGIVVSEKVAESWATQLGEVSLIYKDLYQ